MKMLCDIPEREGLCKYALIRLDKLTIDQVMSINGSEIPTARLAEIVTQNPDLIELGRPGTEEEFFALKFKDERCDDALQAYLRACSLAGDREMVFSLAKALQRAGQCSPYRKTPD
jgi:hypothetical protein